MTGVTDEGFELKRLEEIWTENQQLFKSAFGDNFDVTLQSPDGQIIQGVSTTQSLLWEVAQDAYNQFDPDIVKDQGLDSLVKLNGLTRQLATSTRVAMELQGDPLGGITIPAGSIIKHDATAEEFYTVNEVVIGAGTGIVDVDVLAVNPGSIFVAAASSWTVITVIFGWYTATNAADGTTGLDKETDEELRERRNNSVGVDAQSVLDAIFAAVSNVPGVESAFVLENDTNAVDANGLPPHSFQTVVLGGDDTEIAIAISVKKPLGIISDGDTSVPLVDSQGIPFTINFKRPVVKNIDVVVTRTTLADYPVNGDDLIKQAVVEYAESTWQVGDDIVVNQLCVPIHSVPGVNLISVTGDIQGAGSPTSGVITIPFNEISGWDTTFVTVV